MKLKPCDPQIQSHVWNDVGHAVMRKYYSPQTFNGIWGRFQSRAGADYPANVAREFLWRECLEQLHET